MSTFSSSFSLLTKDGKSTCLFLPSAAQKKIYQKVRFSILWIFVRLFVSRSSELISLLNYVNPVVSTNPSVSNLFIPSFPHSAPFLWPPPCAYSSLSRPWWRRRPLPASASTSTTGSPTPCAGGPRREAEAAPRGPERAPPSTTPPSPATTAGASSRSSRSPTATPLSGWTNWDCTFLVSSIRRISTGTRKLRFLYLLLLLLLFHPIVLVLVDCSLHYAVVALGTPNVTFLVALDTGSDLFWVPCDCRQCAATTSPSYGVSLFEFPQNLF